MLYKALRSVFKAFNGLHDEIHQDGIKTAVRGLQNVTGALQSEGHSQKKNQRPAPNLF